MSHPIITDQVYFVNRASRGRSERACDSNTNIRVDLNANTQARWLVGSRYSRGPQKDNTFLYLYRELKDTLIDKE